MDAPLKKVCDLEGFALAVFDHYVSADLAGLPVVDLDDLLERYGLTEVRRIEAEDLHREQVFAAGWQLGEIASLPTRAFDEAQEAYLQCKGCPAVE